VAQGWGQDFWSNQNLVFVPRMAARDKPTPPQSRQHHRPLPRRTLPRRSISLPPTPSDSDSYSDIPGEQEVSTKQAKLVASADKKELRCGAVPMHYLVALTQAVGDLSLKIDQQSTQLECLGNDLLWEKSQHLARLRHEFEAKHENETGMPDNIPLNTSDARLEMAADVVHGSREDLDVPQTESSKRSGVSQRPPKTPYETNIVFEVSQVNSRHEPLDMSTPQESGDCFVRFSRGTFWNCTCAFLILAQAVVTGFEVQQSMKNRMDHLLLGGQDGMAQSWTVFVVVELCYLAWMLVELTVNLYGATTGFKEWPWFSRRLWWSFFDMMVIMLTSVTLVTTARAGLAMLRLFRLARLGKLMRNLRNFKIMRRLHNVVISLMASMTDLASSFLVIGLVIYITALLILQGILLETDDEGLGPAQLSTVDLSYWADLHEGNHVEQLFRLYGTLPRTMLTLLQPVSGGMDWNNAFRPILRLRTYFLVVSLVYMFFMIFGLLNVLLGIFVEGAMQSVRCDSDQMVRDEMDSVNASIAQITRVFRASDTDRSGSLDREEFQALLNNPQLVTLLQTVGVDTAQAQTIFRLCDSDLSGCVSYEEFIGGCLRLKGTAKSADMMTLLYQTEKTQRYVEGLGKEIQSLRKQMKMLEPAADAGANSKMANATLVKPALSKPLLTSWSRRDSW